MIGNYAISKLREKFWRSLRFTMKNDSFLVENDASERAIAHKLAEYLQKEFPEWHVDCEYNRNMDQVKRRADRTGFIPDIIVHLRETQSNLIVIEVKKSNGEYNDEEQRLKEATLGIFGYKLGIYVIFNVLGDYYVPPVVKFFSEGKELKQ